MPTLDGRLFIFIGSALLRLLGTLMRKRGRGLLFSTRAPRLPTVEPSIARAQPPGYQLIDELTSSETILEVIRHLPAKDTVALSRCCKAVHAVCVDKLTAAWCADSRRELLLSRARPGDLPLINVDDNEWTLERLHLCEHPPRFPRIFFRFASDLPTTRSLMRVSRVAKLLSKHPKLRIRIHGYAQPDAPPMIGEALAQARATSVRMQLLTLLSDHPMWAGEDPNLGVRDELYMSEPWACVDTRYTQLVGDRVEAIGRWRSEPLNRNFLASEEESDGSASDDDWSKLRRAEFTLLGLSS
ncbi:hypothetical protein AB1Y20_019082 [Prymnesium parvum]|uniref:F-box domain-containing protein n=1 Tax=Prymnesium parvum TaxID=97485 RepID=A0AB34JT03_PRYPA